MMCAYYLGVLFGEIVFRSIEFRQANGSKEAAMQQEKAA